MFSLCTSVILAVVVVVDEELVIFVAYSENVRVSGSYDTLIVGDHCGGS